MPRLQIRTAAISSRSDLKSQSANEIATAIASKSTSEAISADRLGEKCFVQILGGAEKCWWNNF